MQKWTAFILSGLLVVAFLFGLLIKPSDSQANPSAPWNAAYFANAELVGSPIVTRNERTLNFNWASNSPDSLLPTDQFSARWTGTFSFESGQWEFSAGADDGIRLWVDDELVIDQWQPKGDFTVYSIQKTLKGGEHHLRLEYFDAGGFAGVSLDWEPVPTSGDGRTALQATVTSVPAGPIANIGADVLNVRSGPGLQFPRIAQVFLYQRFFILGKTSDETWLLIDLKDGRTGWVSKRFIAVSGTLSNVPVTDQPQGSPFTGVSGVAFAELNIRSGPSTRSEVIGLLPQDGEFTVLGRNSNGAWYFIRYQGVEGWVFSPYVGLPAGVKQYDIPIVG